MGRIKTEQQLIDNTKSRAEYALKIRHQRHDAIPWMTYESIIWLMSRMEISDTIFEWGSGASTVFWKKRNFQVTSIDSKQNYCEATGARYVPWRNNADEYVGACSEPYDVIVVDGQWRVLCFERAIQFTRKFLVVDNMEWVDNQEMYQYLPDNWSQFHCGWAGRCNPFSGPWRGTHKWITSIFWPPSAQLYAMLPADRLYTNVKTTDAI